MLLYVYFFINEVDVELQKILNFFLLVVDHDLDCLVDPVDSLLNLDFITDDFFVNSIVQIGHFVLVIGVPLFLYFFFE